MRAEIVGGTLKIFPSTETEVYAMRTWQETNTHQHDNSTMYYITASVLTLDCGDVGKTEF